MYSKIEATPVLREKAKKRVSGGRSSKENLAGQRLTVGSAITGDPGNMEKRG